MNIDRVINGSVSRLPHAVLAPVPTLADLGSQIANDVFVLSSRAPGKKPKAAPNAKSAPKSDSIWKNILAILKGIAKVSREAAKVAAKQHPHASGKVHGDPGHPAGGLHGFVGGILG